MVHDRAGEEEWKFKQQETKTGCLLRKEEQGVKRKRESPQKSRQIWYLMAYSLHVSMCAV